MTCSNCNGEMGFSQSIIRVPGGFVCGESCAREFSEDLAQAKGQIFVGVEEQIELALGRPVFQPTEGHE